MERPLKAIIQMFLLIGLVGLLVLAVGIYMQDERWMGPGNAAFLLGLLLAGSGCLILRNRQLARQDGHHLTL